MDSLNNEKIEKKTLNFKSLHFGWFVGHVLAVISTTIFLLSKLIFHPSGFFYRFSYLSLVISYGIVLYNSYKPFNSQDAYFKRILMDENAQYFIIGFYFLFGKRIAISLLPFYLYSIIHTLEFIQTELIPTLAPNQSNIQDQISNLLDKYHEQLMEVVVKIEICGILTRLVLGLFVFKSSILSVLLYANFIRLRYFMSIQTRDFLNQLAIKLDNLLSPETAHPNIPPSVTKTYTTFKASLNLPNSSIKKQE